MLKKEFIIDSVVGLHARPAALFVDKANRFKAKINIRFEDTTVNAKSIISVLSLGLGKGDRFDLIVDGQGEVEAMEELRDFIVNELHESDKEISG